MYAAKNQAIVFGIAHINDALILKCRKLCLLQNWYVWDMHTNSHWVKQTNKKNAFANSLIAHYDAWILIITDTYVDCFFVTSKLISIKNIKLPRKKIAS